MKPEPTRRFSAMLTSLRIKNFKSWADTGEMRLAPITGLFGPNSSGKSSILQLLLLLKQTVESTDRTQALDLGDEQALVDLGTFTDIIHFHTSGHGGPMSTDPTISWILAWRLPRRLAASGEWAPHELHFEADILRLHTTVTSLGSPTQAPVVEEFDYQAILADGRPSRQHIGMKRKTVGSRRYELTTEHVDRRQISGRPRDLPLPIKFYGFPSEIYTSFAYTGFVPLLVEETESLFSRLYYLGPLRDYPSRQYLWGGRIPRDVGRRGERVVDALLASRSRDDFAKERGVEAQVAIWLKNIGLIDSFEIEPISPDSSLYEVMVRGTDSSALVRITDVGFGISQILPVLTLCSYVPKGSTIILEQPEIHLHPLVQAGLADVFIDAIKTRELQIILESHSEHLLRRLQRRIAEEQLAANDAALYFCEMRDGASHLEELELDTYGNIKNWPKDFFGNDLGELVAMTKAEMERRLIEAGE
jgi:hypothetical protein